MVRGYDPVSSDFATLMWNHLFSFWTTDKTLTLADSERYVRHWLRNSNQTAAIYNGFAALGIRPSIKLKKHCKYDALQ
jgi:hypothetical protein